MSEPEKLRLDRRYMRRALSLARRGWGRTSPNPMVGAVAVRNGATVGEGYHRRAGESHAEIAALKEAGERAEGSTLYVNLEPCSTRGRTSPCTEAIKAAGVKRVVAGCEDPDPRHAGRGLSILREAGLQVECGVEEEKCRRLNEAFFCWVCEKRPFVILKLAMTLDGRIATVGGDSKWISGEKSRRLVQKQRRWADAIMVGGETVRRDNPRLKVREPADWERQPMPIICSRSQNFSRDLELWRDPETPPRLIAPGDKQEWRNCMRDLGKENITALLVEGGGELAAAVLAAGIVDQAMFFIAPRILGGRSSRPAVGGDDPVSLEQAWKLKNMRARRIGEDLLVTGDF